MLDALPGTLYVQAHDGDPGPNGVLAIIDGATRGSVTLPPASSGQRSASNVAECEDIPAGASVTHVSYWDEITGGTFRFSESLGVSVSFLYAGRLRFTSQVFTIGVQEEGAQSFDSLNTDATAATDTESARFASGATDSSSTADASTTGMIARHTDATSTSDSMVLSVVAVHTDTTGTSDSVGAAVGIFVSVTDSAGTSDTNGVSEESGASSVDLHNPGFESAIGSVEGDNWWPALPGNYATYGVAERRTTGAITGSYSGFVGVSGEHDDGYEPWTEPTHCYLRNRCTKAQVDASTGHLKFRIKPVSQAYATWIEVAAYDSANNKISNETNYAHIAMLYGTRIGTASDDTSIRIASPANGTTYDVDWNLRAHVESIATWANVAKLIISIGSQSNDASRAEFRCDDFGAQ
jgi:hypothetical protein